MLLRFCAVLAAALCLLADRAAASCVCSNTCPSANTSVCNDGGPGSTLPTTCELGTNCADCGPRDVPDGFGVGCGLEMLPNGHGVIDVDDNNKVYCLGNWGGPSCSEALAPPCTEPCELGEGDCCAIIGANVMMSCSSPKRVVYYDPNAAEYGRYYEDESFVGMADSAFDAKGNLLVSYDDGASYKIYKLDQDLQREVLLSGDNYLMHMFGPDGNLYAVGVGAASGTLYRVHRYTYPGLESTATWTYPLGDSYRFDDLSFVTEQDGSLSIYLLGRHLSRGWVALFRASNVTYAQGSFPFELVGTTGFIDNPMDDFDGFLGLAALDDGSLVLVSRGDTDISRVTRTGKYLESWIPEDFDSLDGYQARVGRNGLVYVSDYTNFFLMAVFDQRGNFIGELGSSAGLKATSTSITFQPGPYVERCKVLDFQKFPIVGDSYTMLVVLRDDGDNLVQDPELVHNLRVTVSGSMLQSGELYPFQYDIPVSSMQWQGEGTFDVELVFERASLAYPNPEVHGEWLFDPALIDYLGGTVPDDPYEYGFVLTVSVGHYDQVIDKLDFFAAPTSTSGANSFISATGLTAVAGTLANVTIITTDMYDNRRAIGGESDLFEFTIGSTAYEPGVPREGVTLNLVDNEDGSYDLSCNITYSGITVLSIAHNGSALHNAPLTLVIQPGEIEAAKSTVSGPGIEAVVPNSQNRFTIKPRDHYSNLLPYNAEWAASFPFDVTIEPQPQTFDVTMDTEALSDGSFSVVYSLTPQKGTSYSDLRVVRVSVFYEGESLTLEDGSGATMDTTSSGNYFPAYVGEIDEDYEMSKGLMVMGVFFSALGLALTCLVAYALYQCRTHSIVKFSQRNFLVIILSGLFVVFFYGATLYPEPSTATCTSAMWIFHLGYNLLFAALFCKTWRVSKIAANTQLKRVKIPDKFLYRVIGSVMAFVLVYLSVWTAVDAPTKINVLTSSEKNSHGVIVNQYADVCSYGHLAWPLTMYLLEIVGLLFGVVLAWQTKEVHEVFAESRHIALAIYNIVCVGGFTVGLLLGLDLYSTSPDTAYFVLSIGTFMCFGGVLTLIFGPKFWGIYKKQTIDHKDFTKGSSKIRKVSKMSSGGSGGVPSRSDVVSSTQVRENTASHFSFKASQTDSF